MMAITAHSNRCGLLPWLSIRHEQGLNVAGNGKFKFFKFWKNIQCTSKTVCNYKLSHLNTILRFRVFPYWPSAKRVSPDDHQAVSTPGFDPLVQVEGISGQTGFSRLTSGVSKPCQSFSKSTTAHWRITEVLFSATRWQSFKGKAALDADLKLNRFLLIALQQTTHYA